jgi:hypothetical protein
MNAIVVGALSPEVTSTTDKLASLSVGAANAREDRESKPLEDIKFV